jgi:hypothetical protein
MNDSHSFEICTAGRVVAAALVLLLCVACTPSRSTLKPPYMLRGSEYSEQELRQIAANRCEVEESRAALPPAPFTTDGCTIWPDGKWTECCIEHDMAYWCGGSASERRRADNALRACVEERSGRVNAALMYFTVRVTGTPWLPIWWRWGYGYPWPYRTPSAGDDDAALRRD